MLDQFPSESEHPVARPSSRVTLLNLFALPLRQFTLKLSPVWLLRHFLLLWDGSSHEEGDQGPFILTMVPTSKGQPINSMQSTRCFSPQRRWQLSKTSWQQKDASGSLFNPTPHTSEDLGGCSKINEIPPAENTGFSCCHIWGTLYTVRDRGVSKLKIPMRPIRRPFQSYIFVSWTLPYWWTTHPITCHWLY